MQGNYLCLRKYLDTQRKRNKMERPSFRVALVANPDHTEESHRSLSEIAVYSHTPRDFELIAFGELGVGIS